MLIKHSNASALQSTVESCIRGILGDRVSDTALDVDTKLNAELGMDSLELAELVLELETALGADPFVELVPITSIRTVGDLVHAYELLGQTQQEGDGTQL
jgi:acyl carrier protein